jgi:hypothetical protein
LNKEASNKKTVLEFTKKKKNTTATTPAYQFEEFSFDTEKQTDPSVGHGIIMNDISGKPIEFDLPNRSKEFNDISTINNS